MNTSKKVPGWLKPCFWDISIRDLDLNKNSIFIIERLLNEGDQESLNWLFKTYTEEKIKEAVLVSRGLSLKTARCWQNYFDLKEEEMSCFGTRSTGRERFF
ncbi:DUF6922 domain-containing protein [Desulfotomaculum copahuensis]|uniref:DUF6922 domain-containing protein n=1 Tax=Desulfotomaculum copahuensis TaxID=1838280 RepID=A0A1B7LD56_9FIRM|nr:hypothetical protein [Desulfotomaculum copahuensis]OAT80804.1 hypothetical protein A6M21_12490 [Desulfotomaculum copahuensis]